jgi:hypothetical protein
MVNVPVARAPTAITASRRPVEQGWMPPSLARHRRRLGESLLYVGACLGLLLYCDISFCLLIGIGLHLLRTWWLTHPHDTGRWYGGF